MTNCKKSIFCSRLAGKTESSSNYSHCSWFFKNNHVPVNHREKSITRQFWKEKRYAKTFSIQQKSSNGQKASGILPILPVTTKFICTETRGTILIHFQHSGNFQYSRRYFIEKCNRQK